MPLIITDPLRGDNIIFQSGFKKYLKIVSGWSFRAHGLHTINRGSKKSKKRQQTEQ